MIAANNEWQDFVGPQTVLEKKLHNASWLPHLGMPLPPSLIFTRVGAGSKI
jgi:hypothetical protein